MVMNNGDLKDYFDKEIKKIKGLYIPVNISLFDRILYKNAKVSDIHPNLDDEFCFPEVGPSFRIIGEYEKDFNYKSQIGFNPPPMEPLIVMRAHPDGYILVNGHHRWGAALKIGLKKVPIKVVNLMLEEDIKRILDNSDHDKRVTLDLDEVVFRAKQDEDIEKTPFGILIKRNPNRIRIGIPALFRFLKTHGYDIWVYSSKYYSFDDIRLLLRRYSVHVDGIITGMGKKGIYDTKRAQAMKGLIQNKYSETIHVDNDMLLVTHNNSSEFEEIEFNAQGEEWSKKIIEILEQRAKTE